MPDLNDLPGVQALRARSEGDSRVLVAVIDGQSDIEHPTFEGAEVESIRGYWLDDRPSEEWSSKHATHITSIIFGQPGTDVVGLAPRCRGLFLATGVDEESAETEINVARAIEFALSKGAQIIHCAFCHPSQTGHAQDWITRAVRKATDAGAVIVAPAGNDYGENWCVPSTLPQVLAVGALADDGAPMGFTNFGELYDGHSIMGPGENVLGASHGGGTELQKGTSVAAPVLTGLIAALTSAVLQSGRSIQPQHVREVLIETARPCTGSGASRCIGGAVAVDRAMAVLLDGMTVEQARQRFPNGPLAPDAPGALKIPPKVAHLPLPPHSTARHHTAERPNPRDAYKRESQQKDEPAAQPSAAQPSLRYPALLYGIGAVDYEFPDEITKDSFLREMRAQVGHGDVEDRVKVIDYLDANPAEARRLLWTFSINDERRYMISPVGIYAAAVFDMLAALTLGRVRGEITLASLPGTVTGKTVAAMDGTVLQQVKVNSLRGVYGWQPIQVATQSLEAVRSDALAGGVGRTVDVPSHGATPAGDPAIASEDSDTAVLGIRESPVVTWPRLREAATPQILDALTLFLSQVYFRADQLPDVSRDRAISFTATNGYQVAAAFLDAMHDGLQYLDFRTEYSPFARVSGNCWDVIIRFNDPMSSKRAPVEYRMSVDIADVMPVTVGRLRRWSA
jgi:cyanobactin maturation PatA/PatG family protease